ncbi:hypothetical protein IWW55_001277 [Coemansia sp. RSA 2706]|nr:hypothetical protein LPJ63_004095 [Coemansia sp. RSA 2711]KAJ2306803.1 hypothetical protein IWW55_001277 [Coemansia sp. RSA 2706]KAJ2311159.1 hypothetical protein IWW54_002796 [Coemansia sp. RSA 2705]
MSALSRFTLSRSSAAVHLLQRGYASKHRLPHPNSVPLDRAIAILKAYEVGQPAQTVELHVHCAPEKGQPPIRGSCVLPHSFKSNIKVLVFAEGEKAKEALAAGADFVGGAELVDKVRDNQVVFDKCLSTPDMLPRVAKIARMLGPKGLMPTVNKGTVTADIGDAVKFSKNSQDFRADKANIVHTGVAKIGFTTDEILKNIGIVMESVRANAKGSKAKFISRVYLSSTRGPGIQIADA